MISITEELIFETLRQVIDPELGCNIVDLGLIYNVRIDGSTIVDFTRFPIGGGSAPVLGAATGAPRAPHGE